MSHRKYSFVSIFTAIVMAWTTPSIAQRRMMPPPEPVSYQIQSGADSVVVPFQLVNNHILIPVTVNGKTTLQFILDTGMRDNQGILAWDTPEIAKAELEYAEGAQVMVGGAGKDKKRHAASLSTGNELHLGEVVFSDARIIVAPPLQAPYRYHNGVIGAAVFANFAVLIDYDRRNLVLYPFDKFDAPDGWSKIPLEFSNALPYLTTYVTVRGEKMTPVKLVVDLGASHPVSLNTDSDKLSLPEKTIATVIGMGMSGEVTGHVGRIAALELGKHELTDVVATFPDSPHQLPRGDDGRNGNLGNGVLSRFNTIFDYDREVMYLKPNRSFDRPFGWRTTGIVFGTEDNGGLLIDHIVASSPAALAGLQAGDKIIRVNGNPISSYTFQEMRHLTWAEDVSLTLVYIRDGHEQQVSFKTRALI